MVRPKQFDPDGAIATATELFWRQGYHPTSLSQLEKTLNIGRKSIYDTFGDKHSLFLRCLEKYVRMPYPVARPDASWPEIEDMFERSPFFEKARPGCLLANTTLEFGVDEDPDVAEIIRKHTARLERCFSSALARSKTSGELHENLDEKAGGRYLTMALQGMAVMAKSGSSRAQLKASVAMILAGLRVDSASTS